MFTIDIEEKIKKLPKVFRVYKNNTLASACFYDRIGRLVKREYYSKDHLESISERDYLENKVLQITNTRLDEYKKILEVNNLSRDRYGNLIFYLQLNSENKLVSQKLNVIDRDNKVIQEGELTYVYPNEFLQVCKEYFERELAKITINSFSRDYEHKLNIEIERKRYHSIENCKEVSISLIKNFFSEISDFLSHFDTNQSLTISIDGSIFDGIKNKIIMPSLTLIRESDLFYLQYALIDEETFENNLLVQEKYYIYHFDGRGFEDEEYITEYIYGGREPINREESSNFSKVYIKFYSDTEGQLIEERRVKNELVSISYFDHFENPILIKEIKNGQVVDVLEIKYEYN